MRRDLAVYRLKEGKQIETVAVAGQKKIQSAKFDATTVPLPLETKDTAETAPQPETPRPAATNSALDGKKAQNPAPEITTSTEFFPKETTVSPPNSKKRPSPQPEVGANEESAKKRQATDDLKTSMKVSHSPELKLQLNTNTQDTKTLADKSPAQDEKAPDTGTASNNADLDSLFNDPTSAAGLGGDSGPGTNCSGTGPSTGNDFDFATFNASLGQNPEGDENENDSNNISALIPGLSDYANDQATAEPDFEALFAMPTANEGTSGTAVGEVQAVTGELHDTTFDDFNDLIFDMTGDGNEGTAGGNQEFNFDFS
jgi:hypothetical protein